MGNEHGPHLNTPVTNKTSMTQCPQRVTWKRPTAWFLAFSIGGFNGNGMIFLHFGWFFVVVNVGKSNYTMTWILLVMLTTQVWRIESANPYTRQPWEVYNSEIPNFSQWNSVNHQHLRFVYAISKKNRQTNLDNRFVASFHVCSGLSVYLCLHSQSLI